MQSSTKNLSDKLASVYDAKMFISELSAYLVVRRADDVLFLLRPAGDASFAWTRWQRSPIATRNGRTVDAAVAELREGKRVWEVLDSTCVDFVDVAEETEGPQGPRGTDMVNHPNHYAPNGVDSFMHMKDQMGTVAFDGFLQGNVIKYVQRYALKGCPTQDLCKAAFYLFHLALETTDGSPEAVHKVVDKLATTLSHAAEHYEQEAK